MTATLKHNSNGFEAGETVQVIGYFPVMGWVRVRRGEEPSKILRIDAVDPSNIATPFRRTGSSLPQGSETSPV